MVHLLGNSLGQLGSYRYFGGAPLSLDAERDGCTENTVAIATIDTEAATAAFQFNLINSSANFETRRRKLIQNGNERIVRTGPIFGLATADVTNLPLALTPKSAQSGQ